MNNDEFYIGWQDTPPKGIKKTGRVFFALALIAALIFAVVFTRFERGFIPSYFEYGTLTEVTGQLVSKPVWGLRTMENGKVKTIPLVGFGKFGAEPSLRKILEANPEVGEGSTLTLRGTLFHYRDRTWMELTESENSLVRLGEIEDFQVNISYEGEVMLEGEIVDPKCFFGVMNPADKAVHRSCAIRCIAGGIPPVLAIRKNGAFVDYYFIINDYGVPLIEETLPFVGIPIRLSGQVTSFDDWKIIQVDPSNLRLSYESQMGEEVALCE